MLKARCLLVCCIVVLTRTLCPAASAQDEDPNGQNATQKVVSPSPEIPPPQTVLYGAAYYHEYTPYERLDEDVSLMKAAGLNVVRMGESTRSLWEPEDVYIHLSNGADIVEYWHWASIAANQET